MADRKRKLEDEDLNLEKSPKRRKSYSVELKLQIVSEAKVSSYSDIARRYKIDRACIREWSKNEKKLSEIMKRHTHVSKSTGKQENIKKFRLEGGGRKILDENLESVLFEVVVSRRLKGLRVTRETIKEKALELSTIETFKASDGWVSNFMKRFGLVYRQKTHQSQHLPEQLVPKLVDFFHFYRALLEDHKFDLSNIINMDETPMWLDAVASRTISFSGEKTTSLKSTGHDKKNVTVLVAASADGRMKKCLVVFKGQGQSTEDKSIMKRSDIKVCFSDNGWANDEIMSIWLKWIFPAFDFSNKLLVWDSFRAHISDNTKKVITSIKNLYTAVIPGGCTSLIQPCDVGINAPIKSKTKKLFDQFLDDPTQHTFTKAGNMRSLSKTQVCDTLVNVLKSIESETVKNSFTCCGLNPESLPIDITCMKKDRPAEAACDLVRSFWFDSKKHLENPNNEITELDMIAEDIPELIIDNDEPSETLNDTANISIMPESNEDTANQNLSLCGTCPDVPYNIAMHHCSECKENICSECKRSHGIFRSTRDHVISPL